MSRSIAAAVVVCGCLVSSHVSAQSPAAITPFTIHVPDAALQDLKARLRNARYPQELTGSGWDYGTDLAYLKSLVAYWQNGRKLSMTLRHRGRGN
jgi:hypothetical protein